jgi:hypothetical protein
MTYLKERKPEKPLCKWCQRGLGSCDCGFTSEKRCAEHKKNLILVNVPLWKGSGTEKNPHRIVAWSKFWRCPVEKCFYAKPAKFAATSYAAPLRDPSISGEAGSAVDRRSIPDRPAASKQNTLRKTSAKSRDKRISDQRSLFDV